MNAGHDTSPPETEDARQQLHFCKKYCLFCADYIFVFVLFKIILNMCEKFKIFCKTLWQGSMHGDGVKQLHNRTFRYGKHWIKECLGAKLKG